jgi:hypothetical protein
MTARSQAARNRTLLRQAERRLTLAGHVDEGRVEGGMSDGELQRAGAAVRVAADRPPRRTVRYWP